MFLRFLSISFALLFQTNMPHPNYYMLPTSFTWLAISNIVGCLYATIIGSLSFSEFAKERERVENRREFLRVRQNQQIDRALNDYMNWLTKADEIMIEEEEREAQERK